MIKFLIGIICIISVCSAFSQVKPKNNVRVIKIQHISPQLLALILSGKVTFNTFSEPIIRR